MTIAFVRLQPQQDLVRQPERRLAWQIGLSACEQGDLAVRVGTADDHDAGLQFAWGELAFVQELRHPDLDLFTWVHRD